MCVELGSWPDWIIAVGTLGSLGYLIDYARPERRQLEAGIRPIIVISKDDQFRFYFKNIGPGPALNARWTYAEDVVRSVEKLRTVIESNQPYAFGDSKFFVLNKEALSVTYESTSGQGYRSRALTLEDADGDGDLKLQITRL